MLYHFLVPLAEDHAIFNVFRYITFRSAGAILTSLIICLVIGPRMITWLKAMQGKDGQPIRTDGPESHLLTKKGTPTMGGLMILFSMFLSTLLWADLSNGYIWVTLLVTAAYGVLGFMDDYLKVTKRNTKGVSSRGKLAVQIIVAFAASVFIAMMDSSQYAYHLAVPFFKNIMLDLGGFYLVFTMLVIVGSSNAVNLTDGLDGLATVPVVIASACFGLIAYLAGHAVFSTYLHIPTVKGAGELAVIAASMIGAGLGFLWFNAPPARVFMGDTGSLALGSTIGTMSVVTKHELVLAIIGGLFVMEALSVIIQVGYYKMTKKRVFRMAPIHHHFEKLGWSEPTVVIRFWIIAVMFALIGLCTLKLR